MTAAATLPAPDMGARLACLQRLCTDLASGINNARMVLRDNAEDPTTAHLVADALDRLGWMADQAAIVAGARCAPVVGDAESWILNDLIRESVASTATDPAEEVQP